MDLPEDLAPSSLHPSGENKRANDFDAIDHPVQHRDKIQKTTTDAEILLGTRDGTVDLLGNREHSSSHDTKSTENMLLDQDQAAEAHGAKGPAVDKARRVLDSMQDGHEAEHRELKDCEKQLESRLHSCSEQPQSFETDPAVAPPQSLGVSTEDFNTLKASLQEKDGELLAVKQERDELKEALHETKTGIQERVDAAALEAYEKAESKLYATNSSITMEQILGEFEGLVYEIDNLIDNQFRGHPYRKPRTNQHKQLFGKLAVDYEVRLGDEELKLLILKSAIWHEMIRRFLLSPTSADQGHMGKALLLLQRDILGTPCTSFMMEGESTSFERQRLELKLKDGSQNQWKQFQSVRAHIGQYLPAHIEQHHQAVPPESDDEITVQHLWEMAELFILYSRTDKKEELQNSFRGVVKQTRSLARALAKCNDLYVVCMPTVHIIKKTPEGITKENLVSEFIKTDCDSPNSEEWVFETRYYGLTMCGDYMEVVQRGKHKRTGNITQSISPALIRYMPKMEQGDVVVKAKVCL
ncbi:hypothetical protein PFICI_15077 [Pestalotiopsis fici W106-1]|uniref:Uncharacterized protein n=1 Tax=Pestalotiopsis fici (strain W106-1 / CGMCC3.15140) TaxID=1229662 RepID=W3WIZ4_PESFW|nr:uncharacterized protein PFICI_15077 [Pestalotiopsis fici W106-1]ETS73132.1 hypothetical protein PFICI_15077 [Pestalotiopsis fici W106-1]